MVLPTVIQRAPPPEPIDFEDNADAIALQSAISVLLLQRKKADQHIRLLRDHKDASVADPARFAELLAAADRDRSTANLPFKDAFSAQAIASCPQINWEQYAVVGEPLDRLHAEQVSRPPETAPSVYSGGVYESGTPAAAAAGSGSLARPEEYRGPLAPYSPWRDAADSAPSKSRSNK
ncbi:Conserved hypothetical, protein [Geosmithia morbida]|uniref:Conserved hypothetical, protein n=1 Tax=Geosmithia morbida TaxID=1094350 RepID=A0A9P4YRU1_9HYPO|nr:Conserved hypothetical, protein [Geosmithia morbida]KAF4121377.1 Conserved hypothetical, protein [Geosmithia morbida]